MSVAHPGIGSADQGRVLVYCSQAARADPTGNNPLIAACAVNGAIDGGLNWALQRLSGRKVEWGDVANAALMGCMLGQAGEALSLVLATRGAGRAGSCLASNSFTADAPLFMADGTRKLIKDVKIGDRVQAADPETGEAGTRFCTRQVPPAPNARVADLRAISIEDVGGTAGSKNQLSRLQRLTDDELLKSVFSPASGPGDVLTVGKARKRMENGNHRASLLRSAVERLLGDLPGWRVRWRIEGSVRRTGPRTDVASPATHSTSPRASATRTTCAAFSTVPWSAGTRAKPDRRLAADTRSCASSSWLLSCGTEMPLLNRSASSAAARTLARRHAER
ncbi:hypothetical protein OOK50_00675 [Streptomyces sp. NBC_01789]|nr:hypothetical protein [Streptomyces sp. NBC_01789]MCX4444933.1 hypothetical protein [Streptomyces sp. NBC_01789]